MRNWFEVCGDHVDKCGFNGTETKMTIAFLQFGTIHNQKSISFPSNPDKFYYYSKTGHMGFFSGDWYDLLIHKGNGDFIIPQTKWGNLFMMTKTMVFHWFGSSCTGICFIGEQRINLLWLARPMIWAVILNVNQSTILWVKANWVIQ